MKAFSVINPSYNHEDFSILINGKLEFFNTQLHTGIIEINDIGFDSESENFSGMVLIKVEAFSCNFRDKVLLLQNVLNFNSTVPEPFAFTGSDFCGKVVAIGPNVKNFQIGDRVIPDNCFPGHLSGPVLPGIPTNNSSIGLLALPESKLCLVPDQIDSLSAACISLGAQTAFSMIRKAGIEEGAKVLVTSAKSNTSLFLLDALEVIKCEVWVLSSSELPTPFQERFPDVKILPSIKDVTSFRSNEQIVTLSEQGGFDVVFDPFFDLHLPVIIDYISINGVYITCGMLGQHPRILDADLTTSHNQLNLNQGNLSNVMVQAILRNISLIGNCIGTTADLQKALQLIVNGDMKTPIIDSVYKVEEGVDFLSRSFLSKDRFGKVVMFY